MARKKFLDEDEENQGVQRKCQQKDVLSLKPFHNHHFLGGGTKNEYRSNPSSKNFDESHEGAVGKQLSTLGLSIREMPGDGNCLFRALSDQITGSSRNHLEYRRAVVQYMKEFRADFEPFIDVDECPFEKYVQRLSQAGTFAGNDAIVAFARLHNVSVVIHQLNTPAWVIHPSKDSQEQHGGSAESREVHIFYHNANHYNSVRRIGDDSENPTNIRLHAQSTTKPNFHKASGKKSPPNSACSNATSSEGYYESKRDEDYWVKDSEDVDRLVESVMQQTNYPDPTLIRETLIDYNFDMVATIDFIISMSVMMNQHSYHENVETNDKVLLGEKIPEDPKTPLVPSAPLTSDKDPDESTVDETNARVNPEFHVPETSSTDNEKEDISSESSQIPVKNDEGQGSSEETQIPSQKIMDKDDKVPLPVSRKEVRLSNRQKKEQKRRERKREADRRKISNPTDTDAAEKENTVIIPLGSLDI